MATPIPTLRIKSAARKLPIKRASPHQASDSPIPVQPINPNPNPNPNPSPIDPHAAAIVPFAAAAEDGYYDDFSNDEEDPDPSAADFAAVGEEARPPPFKFHRVWSEPDEIRFLQGLLGCFSQGMVFPRDLNLFYDRFSESMPQPFTRSQLSEKLRRLRRKYRVMSSRIEGGRDPSRLAPHDRDLLHLCTRLWHPSHAASSPFSPAPDGASPATGNKRRRPNPRGPSGRTPQPGSSSSPPDQPLALPPPVPTPAPAPSPSLTTISAVFPESLPTGVEGNFVATTHIDGVIDGVDEEIKPLAMPLPPPPVSNGGAGEGSAPKQLVAKTVLDIFDGSLNELRTNMVGDAMLPKQEQQSGDSGASFMKRWQEQRLAELDVLARRLRLILEDSLQN